MITIKPEDADLLIAVRTGRLASAGAGVGFGKQNGTSVAGPV